MSVDASVRTSSGAVTCTCCARTGRASGDGADGEDKVEYSPFASCFKVTSTQNQVILIT